MPIFPLQLVPLEKQAHLTARRACPSAARDLGAPLSDHLAKIKQLVRDDQLAAEPITAPRFKAGESRDWKTIRTLLEVARGLLQDERYPVVRRLVHVVQYAGLLDQAKTRSMDDRKLIELARTLQELVAEESKPFFADRIAPKRYATTLFHLLGIDCARLHPHCRHQRRWKARFQLVETAWRVLRGAGTTPPIDSTFPKVPMSQLEEPTGPLPIEVYQPLTRYFEAHAGSYLYAIADRREWSILDSMRGLAILFPAALWLLRWIAANRTPTADDMVNIIVALDRSQGYAPLNTSLHRKRLKLLAADHQLERLIVWYAR